MQRSQISYEMKSDSSSYSPSFNRKSKKSITHDTGSELEINYDNLITEDDEPVDNLFSERQQKLLTDTLYANWKKDKLYLACANVGIYEKIPKEPIVPDVFLSMDVVPAKDIWKKKNRCYMIGVFGKPPELVIEVVSNKVGKERKEKFKKYERMEIKYYVIYDPDLRIFKSSKLHAYELKNGKYVAFPQKKIKKFIWLTDLEVGLTLYNGLFQQMDSEWLTWCNSKGKAFKNPEEKLHFEQKRLMAAEKRAKNAHKRAEDERKRAEDAEKELALLKAKLASME